MVEADSNGRVKLARINWRLAGSQPLRAKGEHVVRAEKVESHMKGIVVSGAAIAAAAVALALLAATPAVAKHKPHQQKAKAGKMACNAKMSCAGRK